MGVGAAVLGASLLTGGGAGDDLPDLAGPPARRLEGVTMMVAHRDAVLRELLASFEDGSAPSGTASYGAGAGRGDQRIGSGPRLGGVSGGLSWKASETVLFYKALFLTGGGSTAIPIVLGILLASVILVAVRTSGSTGTACGFLSSRSSPSPAPFLYYGIRFCGERNRGASGGRVWWARLVIVPWGATVPALGIYPTVGVPAASECAGSPAALPVWLWTFIIEPRARSRRRASWCREQKPGSVQPADPGRTVCGWISDMLRSLERMGADLAALRAEVERLKQLAGRAAHAARRSRRGSGRGRARIRRGAVAELRDE